MENFENVRRRHRLSWGIVMIVVGGMLCLQFTGLLPNSLYQLLFCWQSIFLAIGLAELIQGKLRNSLIFFAIGIVANYHR